jgi:HEAT repeat protein
LDQEALLEGWPKDRAPARQINQDRYYAAHVLREIGDKRAVPALIKVLEEESINYQAAIVLGHLGDKRAIPALLSVLERAQTPQEPYSRNTDMRFYAGYGLMWLRHPTGLLAVAQCLTPDRDYIQRRYAADALGEFGDKDAVPFLIKALKDKDVEVRVNAIMALGRIGDKAAIPALKVSLQDTSQAKGRARIEYQPPMPFFKWMTVREAASQALKQIGKRN